MPDRPAVIYRYDGSFDGLLCCVFESYARRETPLDIRPADDPQAVLFPTHEVPTDADHAQRVFASLQKRISSEAQRQVQYAFLSCADDKALLIYRFIRLGLRHGARVMSMLTNDTVCAVDKAVRALLNERHHLLEFLRFSDFKGVLVATIEPKNFVLPLMQEHFCSRFPEERFLIYDKAHGMALIYRPYSAQIFSIEQLELPEADEYELAYRRLWKQYYNSIAIETRYNPRCRMGHMPKRFWGHMTEFEQEQRRLPHTAAGQVLPASETTDLSSPTRIK
ncbi:TIGR03915 family putative DNA repair protein [Clostridiaceae bacterium NSJ-31]|uniref:TIGR03915 family putative DNA repair protein n=1 Tax=Ligaoa zhengdingensis TaxID=2763658 RepID=A0A926DXS2_9FIRM|nr:TIGR03915 family putative DNA repair protein [Ligaoa zhengdingensis]MBC8545787.1 TIGR03915 family putative DNA repair protein [Ligaoa zhengdingensis]